MIVAKDGTGDYSSLQKALESIPKDNTTPITIRIKNGVYKEKISITLPHITLIGEDPNQTIITYDDYALKTFKDGTTFGTFNSYTLFVGVHDFTAQNLTIQNESGPGSKVGQAIAVYVDADRVCFKNCRFIGYQDTLFTGPLPPAPLTPGSFRGPRENAPQINGRHYYEHCIIQGDIDFIFGSATAYFKKCTIISNDLGQKINGYITAASTPKDQKYGYVFCDCKLVSSCKDQTVYLGRPWRDYAHVVFIHCEMGSHITKEGWHDWDKPLSHNRAKFGEYHNYGLGGDCRFRASWSRQLTAAKAADYSLQSVLQGDDLWTPWL